MVAGRAGDRGWGIGVPAGGPAGVRVRGLGSGSGIGVRAGVEPGSGPGIGAENRGSGVGVGVRAGDGGSSWGPGRGRCGAGGRRPMAGFGVRAGRGAQVSPDRAPPRAPKTPARPGQTWTAAGSSAGRGGAGREAGSGRSPRDSGEPPPQVNARAALRAHEMFRGRKLDAGRISEGSDEVTSGEMRTPPGLPCLPPPPPQIQKL